MPDDDIPTERHPAIDEIAAEAEPKVADLYLGSGVIPLVERAVRDDGSIPVKIIQPGWGSSGYYSEALLKEYAAKWKPGVKMFLDHPTESERHERPERSVRDFAGVLTSQAEYREQGPDGPGLYAEAQVIEPYKPMIEAIAPHIGVSIRAHGVFEPGEAEGRKGRVITRIDSVESVDFVTQPGAGGKVLALMESLRGESSGSTVEESSDTSETSVENSAASEAATEPEESSMELQEAQERIGALEAELTEARKAADYADERADRAELALAVIEAKAEATKALTEITLPDAAKERIAEGIAKNPPLAEGKLDVDAVKAKVEEAAKVESEYLERVMGAGKVTDQGESQGKPDVSQIKESATARFARVFGMPEEVAKKAVEGR